MQQMAVAVSAGIPKTEELKLNVTRGPMVQSLSPEYFVYTET